MNRKINFRLAALTMLLAIFMIPANGQGGQRGGQGAGQGNGQVQRQRIQQTEADVEQRVDRLAESLELNEEQKTKILALEKEQFKKTQAMRTGFDGQQASPEQRTQMREKMKETREVREKKYKEILTEEQYAKYIKLRDERMQNRQRPGDSQNKSGDRPSRGRGR
jgi:periplasmic protein CpxP/Spy